MTPDRSASHHSGPRLLDRLQSSALLVLLGAVSGAVAGVASFVFLEALHAVTNFRVDNDWMLVLLPAAGFAIGLTYYRLGGHAAGGTSLAVGEARQHQEGTPARMAPLVLAGTVTSHLFGASVGREGTAIQMSSSLTEAGSRALGVDDERRAVLARAALAGGFGSVFGVPFAGVAFALELTRRRSIAWTVNTLITTVPAAFVGNAVTVGLGYQHTARPRFDLPYSFGVIVRLVVLGFAFGLAARLFVGLVTGIKRLSTRWVGWPPLRPAVGGGATAILALLVGRDYLGLSLPLLDDAVGGGNIDWCVPVLKILATSIALGSGFIGGEVTPLFVIGGTLGSLLAVWLNAPQVAFASIGLVVVFGAAAHVPVACAVMAAELFGLEALAPAMLVGLCAVTVVGGTGIYDHQITSARAPSRGARVGRGSGRRST